MSAKLFLGIPLASVDNEAMRLMRYMFVPWTILLVYSFFSFFLGQSGLYARRHLEAEYIRLLENNNALEAINRTFLRTKENLVGDDDALSVYARQLGFGHAGEEFIRVVGLGIAANVNLPSGQVLYATEPHFVPNGTIKVISVIFGVAVLLFLLIHDFHWFREKIYEDD